MPLSAIKYYGGKTYHTTQWRWIAALLPSDTRILYAEPYAGMLGILLQRPPANLEIVNDLNGRVVNWWQVVRDRPDELTHKMKYTPNSEEVYKRAIKSMDIGDPVDRALAYTVCIMQSMAHCDGKHGGFAVAYKGGTRATYWHKINKLSDRLRNVQILCRPASSLIERVGIEPASIMYVDPPYRHADWKGYSVYLDEREALLDLLPRARGKVAISGYGDEWDDLDWHRNELSTTWPGIGNIHESEPRTEVLWTNYQAETKGRLFN